MKLRRVELYCVERRFVTPVLTAAGEHRVRPVAYVCLRTDEADGWGECAALADGTSVDPTFALVRRELEAAGIGRLLAATSARGGHLPPASQVAGLFGSSPLAHLVAATLEMAVLDAELRSSGEPLWARLGVDDATARAGVPAGGLVGIPPGRDVETLLGQVHELVSSGRSARLRVKIEPGWDADPLRQIRSAFPELSLQADANGSYMMGTDGLDDASRLADLDGLGLACIEQPLPPGDLAALAQLAARLDTPVALDESLTTLHRLRDALRYGACEVACLKPARLGGLLRARSAARICEEAEAGAFVGGFFETRFARSANAALAGLRAFTLAGDVSDPSAYLDEPRPVGALLDEPRPVGDASGPSGALVPLHDGPGIAPAPLITGPAARTWRVGG